MKYFDLKTLEIHNLAEFNYPTAFLFALLSFLVLSLLYNLLFKQTRAQFDSLNYLLQKIRFLTYLYVILIPLAVFFAFMPESFYKFYFSKAVYFSVILLTIIFLIEILSTLFFDLIIIKKQKTGVPYLFRDLVRFTLYFILFLTIASKIFQVNIQTLLTTSAVFSIILGLALQDTLGNLFSGLAMHLSKPYSIGDWIQVGTNIGIVEKIDWRSTTIKTFTDDHITIPNSNISKVEIENFSTPTKTHARILDIGAHYKHAPNKVKKAILRSALETEGVLHEPFPKILLQTFADFSINYKLWIWIDNFAEYKTIESRVKEKIWYRFKREDIEIPFPIRNIYHHKTQTFEETLHGIIKILRKVDFLTKLNDADLLKLAHKIKHQMFAAGEVLFNQGEPGKTFYIINSGHVQVTVKNNCGEIVLVREMGKYDFFGEMSLLTGDPRSATISAIEDTETLVLEKDDLRDLLELNEEAKETISQILAERQLRTKKSFEECVVEEDLEQEPDIKKQVETLSGQILRKITDFFSM